MNLLRYEKDKELEDNIIKDVRNPFRLKTERDDNTTNDIRSIFWLTIKKIVRDKRKLFWLEEKKKIIWNQ